MRRGALKFFGRLSRARTETTEAEHFKSKLASCSHQVQVLLLTHHHPSCTDQRELARLALYWILGKMDLILGVVLLGVAMWVRAKMLLSDDPRKKKTVGDEENAWRWMLFVACILLGASNEPEWNIPSAVIPSLGTHVFSRKEGHPNQSSDESGSDLPPRLTSRPDAPLR